MGKMGWPKHRGVFKQKINMIIFGTNFARYSGNKAMNFFLKKTP